MFSLSSEAIDPAALRREIDHPEAGGCVCFEGTIRNHNEGRGVASLEYEAYPDLAENEGNRILDEARDRWPVLAIRVVHRTGHLQIGDVAVWVGVACAHRKDAFDACQFVIDTLKQRVPIWKKEHYDSGDTRWLRGGG